MNGRHPRGSRAVGQTSLKTGKRICTRKKDTHFLLERDGKKLALCQKATREKKRRGREKRGEERKIKEGSICTPSLSC